MHKRGRLITFEGGEGSGKTTLLEALYQHLLHLGFSVIKTRAPGATEVGRKIRDLVLHQKVTLTQQAELFLFLADRAQHVEEILFPELKKHTIILCDRFNDSTVAYQGAARGGDLAFIEKLCMFATGGLAPDLTLYLDVPPSVGLHRARSAIIKDGKASYDRVEQEKLDFHERVRLAYLDIVKQHHERVELIDSSQSIEQVFEIALDKIMTCIEEKTC